MNSSPHLKYFISIGLFSLGAGLTLLGSVTSQLCMWIGLAIAVIGSILSLTIRCPNCGSCLVSRRWGLPKFCPNCGQKVSGSEFED